MRKTRTRTVLTLAVFLLALAAYAFLVGCPFRQLFGVKCPMCGMTRAFLSLLRLDLREAFRWHPAWPAALVLIPLFLILELRKSGGGKLPGLVLIAVLGVTYAVRLVLRDPVVWPNLREGLVTGFLLRLFGGK